MITSVDGEPSEVQPTSNVQSTVPPLTRRTSRPYGDKSPAEKEELLERIAAQLADIGDLYELGPPTGGASKGSATG